MAKATEVSNSSTSKTHNEKHDLASLSVEDENAPLDLFMSNLQGESKIHFEALMSQYGESQELLEKKFESEREDALEIASLAVTLEEGLLARNL